jgi:hypothetical protein
MPATYEPIATTISGSTTARFTFSSIGNSYTDLVLIFRGTVTPSDGLALQLNNDSATNYSNTFLAGNGSTVSTNRNTTQNYIYLDNLGVLSGSTPGFYRINLFSYAGSTNKTILIETSSDKNGSGSVERIVGLWRSTSAITDISIFSQNGYTINAGFSATLYGILKA